MNHKSAFKRIYKTLEIEHLLVDGC